MRREFGDFQTPPALVAALLDALGPIGTRWPRVLEPTCGRGHFLAALRDRPDPPRELIGIELQAEHCQAARTRMGSDGVIIHASLFDLDLRRDLAWRATGPLLVVGNPPWVTNAALGALESANLPRKSNVKALRGLDARTGASNFDLAEAVWLKLIAELAGDEPTTIALLCKTAVARKVLECDGLPIVSASLHRIDAARWFGAAVEACWFCVTIGPGSRVERIPVHEDIRVSSPHKTMGFASGRRLVADVDAYAPRAGADGRCALTWRQGVKHDAAAVMELRRDEASGALTNRAGASVEVETDYVYPLLKGSDLARPGPLRPTRAVIVTQERLGQETDRLEADAPRLWSYLRAHADSFARRKSSIYRNRAEFAMFGIGPYSFAADKVVVSGLHKTPRFHAVGPFEGRPVLLDDTCYFAACDSPEEARDLAARLNDPETLALIHALTFDDAKRPITKALLQRLDLEALARRDGSPTPSADPRN